MDQENNYNDYNVNNKINNEDQSAQNLNQNKRKKRFKKIFFIILLLFVLGVGFYYFKNQTKKNQTKDSIYWLEESNKNRHNNWEGISNSNPFLVGIIMSDHSYNQYEASLLAAQHEINQEGGINGRALRYIKEEGSCTIEGGRLAALRLVNDFGVDALMGGQCSDEFIGSAPIAQEAGILSFSPSVTNPEISKLGKYLFRLTSSDDLAGKYAANFAIESLMASTTAILLEDKIFPLDLGKIFKEEFIKKGGEIIYDIKFPTNNSTLIDIDKIKELSPDIIYLITQRSGFSIDIINKLKSAGVQSKILSSEVIFEKEVLNNNNGELDEVMGVKIVIDEESSKYNQFLNITNSSRLDVLLGYAQGMYDIIFLIKESYEVGNGDPDLASDYLYNLENWEGVIGSVSFDQNGDVNLPLGVYMISGNDIEILDVN
jgi:branched-chain amino acid transport system substrate-binding protein